MLFVKKEDILARVDHTALKATATWKEICTLCEEALEYHTASVCIPPSYVARAHAAFPGLNMYRHRLPAWLQHAGVQGV